VSRPRPAAAAHARRLRCLEGGGGRGGGGGGVLGGTSRSRADHPSGQPPAYLRAPLTLPPSPHAAAVRACPCAPLPPSHSIRDLVDLIRNTLNQEEDNTVYVPAALAKAIAKPLDALKLKVRAAQRRGGRCTRGARCMPSAAQRLSWGVGHSWPHP
jgi:hypothetical protein